MACYNQTSTQIKLVFESGSFTVNSLQFSSERIVNTLYFDKYFYFDDGELPTPYHQHIIGFLYEDDCSQNYLKYHFYNTLSSFKTIYRAFDENPEGVFFILCDDLNPISRFLVIFFSFQDLASMNIFLNMFQANKAHDIHQHFIFNSWVESYNQSLAEYLKASDIQKGKLAGLAKDLKELKEQEKNSKQAKKLNLFGECLLCCDNPRTIVYVPCGHIVACIHCTVKCMKIELNRKINRKRTPKLCPLCNGAILKAMEVVN